MILRFDDEVKVVMEATGIYYLPVLTHDMITMLSENEFIEGYKLWAKEKNTTRARIRKKPYIVWLKRL